MKRIVVSKAIEDAVRADFTPKEFAYMVYWEIDQDLRKVFLDNKCSQYLDIYEEKGVGTPDKIIISLLVLRNNELMELKERFETIKKYLPEEHKHLTDIDFLE